MSKGKKWLIGWAVISVIIIVLSHTVLAPLWNIGSAIAHYYIPILVLGFVIVMCQDGLSDLWSYQIRKGDFQMGNPVVTGVIAIVYLVIMIGVGIYFNKKNKDLGDFLIGKSMGIGPIVLAFTYMATSCSAGSYIGEVTLVAGMGYSAFYIGIMSLGGTVLNYFFLGKRINLAARRTGAITPGDLISYRYYSPKAVRLVQAVVLVVCITASMLAQFSAAGMIFEAMVGIPHVYGVLIGAGFAMIYVSLGGFMAVAWTDFIQGIIMVLGALFVLIGCIVNYGSLADINAQVMAMDPSKLTFFGNPESGGITVTLIFVYFFSFLLGHFGYVPCFTRFMAARKAKQLRTSLITIVIVNICFNYLGKLAGIYALVNPIDVPVADHIYPALAVRVLPPVLAGVLLAAILAASMSTIDSLILLLSGVCVRDVYQKVLQKKDVSEKKLLNISRIFTVVLTAIGIILALNPPAAIVWIATFAWGGITCTFAPTMILGFYWKRNTKQGAVAGMILGFSLAMIWYMLGHPGGIHGLVLGFLVNTATQVIVSNFTPRAPEEVIKACFPTKEEVMEMERDDQPTPELSSV